MAACRRRVVYFLLTLLFLVDISSSSQERNTDDQQLSDNVLYRVKRAVVPGDNTLNNPQNPNVLKQPGVGVGAGDADRNAGAAAMNPPFRKPVVQSNFGQGNVGRGFPVNPGGVGAGVGAGNVMDNQAHNQFGVPAANNHFPGGDALHNLGNIPLKPKKPSKIKISSSNECAADVQKFCSKGVKDNNFSILDCLQSDERVMVVNLTICSIF